MVSKVLLLIPVIFLLVLFVPITWVSVRAWLRFRRLQAVVCPLNDRYGYVHVPSCHGVFRTLVGDVLRRVSACTFLGDKPQCDRGCLAQITVDTRRVY
jgi:hypothetical protein